MSKCEKPEEFITPALICDGGSQLRQQQQQHQHQHQQNPQYRRKQQHQQKQQHYYHSQHQHQQRQHNYQQPQFTAANTEDDNKMPINVIKEEPIEENGGRNGNESFAYTFQYQRNSTNSVKGKRKCNVNNSNNSNNNLNNNDKQTQRKKNERRNYCNNINNDVEGEEEEDEEDDRLLIDDRDIRDNEDLDEMDEEEEEVESNNISGNRESDTNPLYPIDNILGRRIKEEPGLVVTRQHPTAKPLSGASNVSYGGRQPAGANTITRRRRPNFGSVPPPPESPTSSTHSLNTSLVERPKMILKQGHYYQNVSAPLSSQQNLSVKSASTLPISSSIVPQINSNRRSSFELKNNRNLSNTTGIPSAATYHSSTMVVGSIPNTSSLCGEIFVTKNARKWTFMCTYCQKSTRDIGEFVLHIRLNHLNDYQQLSEDEISIDQEEADENPINDGELTRSTYGNHSTMANNQEYQDEDVSFIK